MTDGETGVSITIDEFVSRLERAGLQSHTERLVALARPSIRLHSESADDSEMRIGASRLGGRPDVPVGFEWPVYDDLPQSFIAQINLADTAQLDLDGELPSEGLLSFFYDSDQRVWGFDPSQDGAWMVAYSPPGTELVRREPPRGMPEEAVFNPMQLRTESELTFAPWESFDVQQLELDRDEQFAYVDVLGSADRGPLHRVLGHPDPVQGDMQLECQLVHHGLYCGGITEDPRASGLRSGAAEWRLLLQVDTDDPAGMMWGDVGMIYYWITTTSLRQRNWNEARLILQSS
jgi:uncharacterized protein YwqG